CVLGWQRPGYALAARPGRGHATPRGLERLNQARIASPVAACGLETLSKTRLGPARPEKSRGSRHFCYSFLALTAPFEPSLPPVFSSPPCRSHRRRSSAARAERSTDPALFSALR